MHSFITDRPPVLKPSPDILEIHPDKSIGIDEIRQVTSFLSRKPTQSDQNTVVIHEAHLLTLPAQNAFLKTLEEPPAHAQIYLITEFPDQLLPTVLSRCQNMSYSSHSSNTTYSQSSLILFQHLLTSEAGDRLKLLEATKFDRNTALEFFNDCEKIIHDAIINKNSFFPVFEKEMKPSTARREILILESKKYLKSNVNLKLILDNFAIQFS